MSARAPRLRFATPFVVTLAGAAGCLVVAKPAPIAPPASGGTTVTDNRGQATTPPPASGGTTVTDNRGQDGGPATGAVTNPPRPGTVAATPTTTAPPPAGPIRPGGAVAPTPTTNAPPTGGGKGIRPGDAMAPGGSTVAGGTGKPMDPGAVAPDKSQAPGPTGPAGVEARWNVSAGKDGVCKAARVATCPAGATCNPPPPVATTCPSGMKAGTSVQVMRAAGGTECFVVPAPTSCPKGAACNPPPPTKVACPSR
ncbi:MAG: hypothetical protein KBG28_00865 [Kofleriaceae bacterium]|jgi:hypothetical protein|nr:hypothetical protein [Kofleriaceae bacterium]MBP9202501.1 hypothetical protein [Kofleriaceae bacterium]